VVTDTLLRLAKTEVTESNSAKVEAMLIEVARSLRGRADSGPILAVLHDRNKSRRLNTGNYDQIVTEAYENALPSLPLDQTAGNLQHFLRFPNFFDSDRVEAAMRGLQGRGELELARMLVAWAFDFYLKRQRPRELQALLEQVASDPTFSIEEMTATTLQAQDSDIRVPIAEETMSRLRALRNLAIARAECGADLGDKRAEYRP
jgi:hypothetical protein